LAHRFIIPVAQTTRIAKAAVNSQFSTLRVTDTNFHHVAVSKNNSAVVFYVDGVANPVSAYGSIFTFTTSAAIGARGDDLNNSFYGIIDELSVIIAEEEGTT